MGDILSASSMLLAVLAVLFGIWHADIISALAADIPRHAENRKPVQRKIRLAILSRALPLSVASWATLAVFGPKTHEVFQWLKSCADGVPFPYDEVKAAFFLTQTFIGILALYITTQVLRLAIRLGSSYRD